LLNVLLNKGKNGNSMVITQEQGTLTSFLSSDSFELIFWLIFYNFWD
jgi:hypothetical protein